MIAQRAATLSKVRVGSQSATAVGLELINQILSGEADKKVGDE